MNTKTYMMFSFRVYVILDTYLKYSFSASVYIVLPLVHVKSVLNPNLDRIRKKKQYDVLSDLIFVYDLSIMRNSTNAGTKNTCFVNVL